MLLPVTNHPNGELAFGGHWDANYKIRRTRAENPGLPFGDHVIASGLTLNGPPIQPRANYRSGSTARTTANDHEIQAITWGHTGRGTHRRGSTE
jgi:hypothetical protein